jgi:hypothetical protein
LKTKIKTLLYTWVETRVPGEKPLRAKQVGADYIGSLAYFYSSVYRSYRGWFHASNSFKPAFFSFQYKWGNLSCRWLNAYLFMHKLEFDKLNWKLLLFHEYILLNIFANKSFIILEKSKNKPMNLVDENYV